MRQPLSTQSTQTITGDEFSSNFVISYRTKSTTTNFFTSEYLQILSDLENEIRSLPEYDEYCARDPDTNVSAGIQSVLPSFLTGGNTSQLMSEDQIQLQLSTLATHSPVSFKSTFFSKDFTPETPISDVTRSFVLFGFPLAGYENVEDRIVEQKEQTAEFVVKCVKIVEKYADRHASDLDIYYYGGDAAMDYMVDQILLTDGKWAVLSMMFVGAYIGFHTSSVFLAFTGMCHIILSYPMAYFFIRIVLQIKYFDLMNMFLIYVLLGIGADDVLIYIDCFKQMTALSQGRKSKIGLSEWPLHKIIEMTMERAAKAMFVTSCTTCAAFVATSTSGLMPVAQFGTFAALMIACNFLMYVRLFLCVHSTHRSRPHHSQLIVDDITQVHHVLSRCRDVLAFISSSSDVVLSTSRSSPNQSERRR